MSRGKCKGCTAKRDLHRGYCGECLKDKGIQAVLDKESKVWRDKALYYVRQAAWKYDTFSADEVKALAMLGGLAAPHHSNCWGGVFRLALSVGYMEQTGKFIPSRRAKHHKQRIAEYRSLLRSTRKPPTVGQQHEDLKRECKEWRDLAYHWRDLYYDLKGDLD